MGLQYPQYDSDDEEIMTTEQTQEEARQEGAQPNQNTAPSTRAHQTAPFSQDQTDRATTDWRAYVAREHYYTNDRRLSWGRPQAGIFYSHITLVAPQEQEQDITQDGRTRPSAEVLREQQRLRQRQNTRAGTIQVLQQEKKRLLDVVTERDHVIRQQALRLEPLTQGLDLPGAGDVRRPNEERR